MQNVLRSATSLSCDVNGDGRDDLILGAPLANSLDGRISLFLGTSDGLSSAPTLSIAARTAAHRRALWPVASQSNHRLSACASVLSASQSADIDGDGHADLLVGAVDGNAAYQFLGRASYPGLNDVSVATLTAAGSVALGESMALADLNGDGYVDAVIGDAAYSTLEGRVHVYLGNTDGTLPSTPSFDIQAASPAASAEFGGQLAVGDVDTNGRADILVSGVGTSTITILYFDTVAQNFAEYAGHAHHSLADSVRPGTFCGDVDGDALNDLVVFDATGTEATLYTGATPLDRFDTFYVQTEAVEAAETGSWTAVLETTVSAPAASRALLRALVHLDAGSSNFDYKFRFLVDRHESPEEAEQLVRETNVDVGIAAVPILGVVSLSAGDHVIELQAMRVSSSVEIVGTPEALHPALTVVLTPTAFRTELHDSSAPETVSSGGSLVLVDGSETDMVTTFNSQQVLVQARARLELTASGLTVTANVFVDGTAVASSTVLVLDDVDHYVLDLEHVYSVPSEGLHSVEFRAFASAAGVSVDVDVVAVPLPASVVVTPATAQTNEAVPSVTTVPDPSSGLEMWAVDSDFARHVYLSAQTTVTVTTGAGAVTAGLLIGTTASNLNGVHIGGQVLDNRGTGTGTNDLVMRSRAALVLGVGRTRVAAGLGSETGGLTASVTGFLLEGRRAAAQSVAAYYTFDDAASLGADLSGTGNDLTESGLTGATSSGGGVAGEAATFADWGGTPGDIPFLYTTGAPVDLPSGNDPYTLSAWFRYLDGTPEPTTALVSLSSSDDALAGNRLGLAGKRTLENEWNSRPLSFYVHESITDYAPFDDGEWHHVAVTFDGQSRQLFRDGALVTEDAVSGLAALGDEIRLGELLVGEMDEVRILGFALSAGDVVHLLKDRIPPFYVAAPADGLLAVLGQDLVNPPDPLPFGTDCPPGQVMLNPFATDELLVACGTLDEEPIVRISAVSYKFLGAFSSGAQGVQVAGLLALPTGVVLVSDRTAGRVATLAADGTMATDFLAGLSDVGTLAYCAGLVYVGVNNGGDWAIERYATDGTLVDTLATHPSGRPVQISCDVTSYRVAIAYAWGSIDGEVLVYDRRYTDDIVPGSLVYDAAVDAPNESPTGVAFTSSGDFMTLVRGDGSLAVYSSSTLMGPLVSYATGTPSGGRVDIDVGHGPIQAVWPRAGPTSGGATVMVQLPSVFSAQAGGNVAHCLFGSEMTTGTPVDEFHVLCDMPTSGIAACETVSLSVSADGEVWITGFPDVATYTGLDTANLELLFVSPAGGPRAGGNVVSLLVEGICPGLEYTVMMGTNECTDAEFNARDGTLSCTAPAANDDVDDVVPITVAVETSNVAASSLVYRYHRAAVTAASVDPLASLGGEVVTLMGSNFANPSDSSLQVTIDGAAATSVNFIDGTSIEVVTPAGAGKDVTVAVSSSTQPRGSCAASRSTRVDGDLTVSAQDVVVNTFDVPTATIAEGDTSFFPETETFAVGDELLFHQTEARAGAGLHAFAHVSLVDGSGTHIVPALPFTCARDDASGTVCQVVRVPNYDTLTVEAGASLTAPAYSSGKGGMVVVRARTLVNDGLVSVDARGHAGGASHAIDSDPGFTGGSHVTVGSEQATVAEPVFHTGGGGYGASTGCPGGWAGGAGGGHATNGEMGGCGNGQFVRAAHACPLFDIGGLFEQAMCVPHATAGTLACWAGESDRQGTFASVDIGGGGSLPQREIAIFSASRYIACFGTTDLEVYCYSSEDGFLGDGTMDAILITVEAQAAQLRPVDFGPYMTLTGVSCSSSFCCATSSDPVNVRCWGATGDIFPAASPYFSESGTNAANSGVDLFTVPFADLSAGGALTPTYISVGDDFGCVLMSDARVVCFGRNDVGQLGTGDNADRRTAAEFDTNGDVYVTDGTSDLGDVVAIEAGDQFTCALTSSGIIHCWGVNADGQLGIGSTTPSNVAVEHLVHTAQTGMLASQIAVGASHACFLGALSNSLYCWGNYDDGQLGYASASDDIGNGASDFNTGTFYSVHVGPAYGHGYIMAVAAGAANTCVHTSASPHLICWGENGGNQLNDGTLVDNGDAGSITGANFGDEMHPIGCLSSGVLGGRAAPGGDDTRALFFGGGGGGGSTMENGVSAAPAGGSGGGIVLASADEFQGTGAFTARGGSSSDFVSPPTSLAALADNFDGGSAATWTKVDLATPSYSCLDNGDTAMTEVDDVLRLDADLDQGSVIGDVGHFEAQTTIYPGDLPDGTLELGFSMLVPSVAANGHEFVFNLRYRVPLGEVGSRYAIGRSVNLRYTFATNAWELRDPSGAWVLVATQELVLDTTTPVVLVVSFATQQCLAVSVAGTPFELDEPLAVFRDTSLDGTAVQMDIGFEVTSKIGGCGSAATSRFRVDIDDLFLQPARAMAAGGGAGGTVMLVGADASTRTTDVAGSGPFRGSSGGHGASGRVIASDALPPVCSVLDYETPTITDVQPQFVPTAGLETVTIQGSGFGPGSADVEASIDGTLCASASAASDAEITCVLPPGSGGNRHFTIDVGGFVVEAVDIYAYSPPVITGVMGWDGSANVSMPFDTDGGLTILFSGLDLGAVNQTTFDIEVDSEACTSPGWFSESYISCVLPAGVGQGVSVDITTDPGTDNFNVGSTTLDYKRPVVTAVDPATKSTLLGATEITIHGAFFGDASENSLPEIGGTACDSHTHVSDELILCIPPAGIGNDVFVDVVAGGQHAVPNTFFTYFAPVVTDVTPPVGGTDGGTTLTIEGSGYGPGVDLDDLLVTIDGNVCTYLAYTDDGTIHCDSPVGIGAGVDLVVTAGGQPSVASTLFSYIAPAVTQITPDALPNDNGGTEVTILGSNFGPGCEIPLNVVPEAAGTVRTEACGNDCLFGQTMAVMPNAGNASAPDVLIVGAPGAGNVYWMHPDAGSATLIASGSPGFGASLAVGDFNDDGTMDLAVGTYSGSTAGQVDVYYATAASPEDSWDGTATTADATMTGVFPKSLAAAVLHTGTAWSLVVGEPDAESDEGQVSLFEGSSGGIATSATVVIPCHTGSAPCSAGGERFGESVDIAPIVSGAGIMFGAPGMGIGGTSLIINNFAFSATLFGTWNGDTPSALANGVAPGSAFGSTVSAFKYGAGNHYSSAVPSDGSESGHVFLQGVAVNGEIHDPDNGAFGHFASAMTWADVDGDGDPDLIVLSRGLGGTAPPKVTIFAGYSLRLGDLATVLWSQTLSLAPSAGDGVFAMQVAQLGEDDAWARYLTVCEANGASRIGRCHSHAIVDRCGNGVVDGLEECDNGSGVNEADCSRLCCSNVISVTFNSAYVAECTNAYALDHTALTCNAPSGTDDAVSVDVTVGGQSATTSNSFFSYEAPVVTAMEPATADPVDTVAVTIFGSNFGFNADSHATPVVALETTAMTSIVRISDTEIRAVSPQGVGFQLDVSVSVDQQGDGFDLWSYTAPLITSIDPAESPPAGGDVMTILGSFFGETSFASAIATVDGNSCTVSTLIDDSEVHCQIPAGLSANRIVNVRGDMDDPDEEQPMPPPHTVLFTYLSPTVTALEPPSVPTLGVHTITIHGRYFEGVVGSAKIGTTDCVGLVQAAWTDTSVTCVVPQGVGAGIIVDIVSDAGVPSDPVQDDTYFSYDFPVISSIAPATPIATEPGGAVTLTLSGVNFGATDTSPTVDIGTRSCSSVAYSSDALLTCTVPAGLGEDLDLILTVGGQRNAENTLFSYIAPSIATVDPSLFSTNPAGEHITLTGTNFGLQAVAADFHVTIGDELDCPYVSHSDTEVVCAMPAGAGASLDVNLTRVGQTDVSIGAFSFIGPTIDTITPIDGPAVGGYALTLDGDNFGPSDDFFTIDFGGSSCQSVTHVNYQQLICDVPAGVGLTVSITVDARGQSAVTTFDYDGPQILTIEPTNGPTFSSAFTIFGVNFGPNLDSTTVDFGSVVDVPIPAYLNDSYIIFDYPDGVGTGHDVTVTAGGQSSSIVAGFNYDPPEVTAIEPTVALVPGDALWQQLWPERRPEYVFGRRAVPAGDVDGPWPAVVHDRAGRWNWTRRRH